MKMTHPKAKQPIDVHPSQVETMKARGWTEIKPKPTNQKEVKEHG